MSDREKAKLCRARADDWRRHAAVLREHATWPGLGSHTRHALQREAEAAEHMAAWWIQGAADAGASPAA
jgi:hypothetical protein